MEQKRTIRIMKTIPVSCFTQVVIKVGVPFVIKAIGSPNRLFGAITIADGYMDWMIRDGVDVDIQKIDKETIVIPKYDGVYKYNYATIFE